jgi:hypothetical protein
MRHGDALSAGIETALSSSYFTLLAARKKFPHARQKPGCRQQEEIGKGERDNRVGRAISRTALVQVAANGDRRRFYVHGR